MNIYWFIVLLTLVLNRLLPANTDKEYLRNLLITFLPLFIYAAIRVNYGNDYIPYESFFDQFHVDGRFKGDTDHHTEIGYQYINYLLPSFRSVLILSAALLYSSFVFFLYKNIPAKYAWLAIMLIFIMPEKNIFGVLVGIRNGMAVSGLLLSYTFIQMRKPIPVLVISFLLSTIHTSAIAYIPFAYLMARDTPISIKERNIWIGAVVILGFASMSSIINVMMPFFSLFVDRYEESLQEMANEYSRGIINLIANLVMMTIFLAFGEKHSQELTPNQNSLIRMAALYCFAGCLGTVSGRMTIYYGVFYACGIALLYSFKWKNQILKQVMLFFSITISLYAINVWQTAFWWNHGTYHSLLDEIL